MVEIQKAKAFVIEPGKHYIVAFESDEDLSVENWEHAKKSIEKIFGEAGANVKAVLTVRGRLNITEVKK